MYTANDFNLDFNPESVPHELAEEVVQYIIDNVVDFEPRYRHALRIIGQDRCPLHMAYPMLFEDMQDAFVDWAIDHNLSDEDADEFDLEEIFG